MTRSFYSSAIFFTGLFLFLSLFWNTIFYQLGEQVFSLPSLAGLHIFGFLVMLIWALILLKYYHYKQYWFSFWVAAASIVAYFYQFFMVHKFLATAEISVYYFIAILLVLVIEILYGISLVFSEAGRRPWLKVAGIFSIILGLTMVATFSWAMSSIDARIDGTTAEIGKWLSILGSLGIIFFSPEFPE